MLVSASKKNEWILPKGGWEMDEEMEESAIRETFEEAGVLGVLGPKLAEVQYETRKARERRLALEESLKVKPEPEGQFCSGWSDVSQLSEEDHNVAAEKDDCSKNQNRELSPDAAGKPKFQLTIQPAPLPKGLEIAHQMGRSAVIVPTKKRVHTDDQIISQSPLVYSHVRVNLFPLYVKEVMSSWPEVGRLRKAVDIDEAIELLNGRPELQSMVLEVKQRGLHRV